MLSRKKQLQCVCGDTFFPPSLSVCLRPRDGEHRWDLRGPDLRPHHRRLRGHHGVCVVDASKRWDGRGKPSPSSSSSYSSSSLVLLLLPRPRPQPQLKHLSRSPACPPVWMSFIHSHTLTSSICWMTPSLNHLVVDKMMTQHIWWCDKNIKTKPTLKPSAQCYTLNLCGFVAVDFLATRGQCSKKYSTKQGKSSFVYKLLHLLPSFCHQLTIKRLDFLFYAIVPIM